MLKVAACIRITVSKEKKILEKGVIYFLQIYKQDYSEHELNELWLLHAPGQWTLDATGTNRSIQEKD